MRLSLLLAALTAVLAAAEPRTTRIFIEPIDPATRAPAQLAEIAYDVASPADSEIVSFEAPEIPPGTKYIRVGAYDPAAKRWLSSVSATSPDNFSKGYSTTVVVTVDSDGNVLGASCRGVKVDAGYTRDFGPKSKVVVSGHGKQPDLNKPVVLSPEGKKVVQEEKTLLQKYWWVIAIVVVMTLTGGGGDQK